MTTITLEVSDDLAMRMGSCREQLPSLLAKTFLPLPTEVVSPAVLADATHPVYREMPDFLATQPSSRQITEFKLSAIASSRLSELLDKNCYPLLLFELFHNIPLSI